MFDAVLIPHTTGFPGGGRDSLEGGGEVPISRRLQKAISKVEVLEQRGTLIGVRSGALVTIGQPTITMKPVEPTPSLNGSRPRNNNARTSSVRSALSRI